MVSSKRPRLQAIVFEIATVSKNIIFNHVILKYISYHHHCYYYYIIQHSRALGWPGAKMGGWRRYAASELTSGGQPLGSVCNYYTTTIIIII